MKIKNIRFFRILLILNLILMGCTSAYAQFSGQLSHPGVVFNTQDLDRMRDNINVEPWRTGYRIMLNDSKTSTNYQMRGPFERVDRNGDNFREFNDDMDAIYFQSIQFYITGDERYAESAIEMIEAWSSTLEFIGGNVPAIAAADRGVRLLVGAEILRYNYRGWTNNLTRVTEAYARNVLLPPLYIPDPTRTANQGATQMAGAIAVAVYMNDVTLFNQVINAFLNEPCAGISNTLSNGQNGDTGRDYGHPFGMVLTLAQTAEAAHQQGIDLFSVLDNRILALSEYWNALGLGEDVPFIPYGTCYDFFETRDDSRAGSSDFNTNILLEIVNGAYNVRKGIPNPFTTQRINAIPVSINTFFFKKDTDNSRATINVAPYEPHTGTTDNQLTSTRVGSPSNASSSFRNNRWTLTASNGDVHGPSRSDSFQYAYKQMNGDATIIARVNSLNSSNNDAKVGLMFRESLDNDSDMIGVYGHNSGMTHSSWRGQNIINDDILNENGASTNSYRDEAMPAWFKVEIYGNRVSTFYAPDSASQPADEMWSPVSTAFHDTRNDFFIGLFAASDNNDIVTGVFSQVQILTEGDSETSTPATTTTTTTTTDFTPVPNRSYYIDSPVHNLRIGATGNSENPFTTTTNTTGNNVEWEFVPNGNTWHIDRVAGGSLPRLRTDRSELADMQSTDFDGRWESFTLTEGATDGTYFISSFNGPEGFRRLQVDRDGSVNMVPLSFDGSWESFRFTEVEGISSATPTSRVVHITKRNAQGFAIDGGAGGENFQDVYLWTENENNVNQQWIEIDRGNGFYSYQKRGTNFAIDGGRSGANNQNVYLFEINENNQNQHWEKVDAGGGAFRLVKRNAPGFALNGGSGGAIGQTINLFDSSVRSQNLEWFITPLNGVSAKSLDTIDTEEIVIYPNPVESTATIQGAANTTLHIYDMNGSIVLTQNIATDSETLELSTLSSGIYYAQVNGIEGTSVIKIVKQ